MFEVLVYDILILSAAATLIVTLTSYLKIPTIVGFLLSGLLVGPTGLALVKNLPDAYSLTELAGIVLMFTIGLEFSISRLKELKRQFFRLGLTQVLTTIGVVLFLGILFSSIELSKLILWGFLFALSSTALVLKLLNDYRESSAPHGQNSLGILLFQDIAVIPMMILIPVLVSNSESWGSLDWTQLGLWGLKFVGICMIIVFAKKFALPFVLERVIKTRSHELFFFTIIFGCLGLGYLFHWIGLSMSLGAFVAGVLISESAFVHHTLSIFSSVRDTLLGIFFATIGMLLDLEFLLSHFFGVIGLSLAVLMIKFLIIWSICRLNRIPNSISIQTALTVCQIGEFSFLLASRGVELGILTPIDNQYFLSISVLSMIATPFLYMLAPKFAHISNFLPWQSLPKDTREVLDKKLKVNTDKKSLAHTIVIGYGVAGKNIVEAMKYIGLPYKIIEMNYEMIKKCQKALEPAIFGDATKGEVLKHAGIEDARLVVISVSSSKAIPHIIKSIREQRADIQILVRFHFLKELENLKNDPLNDFVVSEIETATELTSKVLRNYGVDSETIFDFTLKARQQLSSLAALSTQRRFHHMSLPSWDALASIRPFVISKNAWACGKRIHDCKLLALQGVMIVSVYRQGVGSMVPSEDFQFHENDVIHVIASAEAFSQVEKALLSGANT